MASANGHTHVKGLHGRTHRATPLVQSVLGSCGEEGSGRACDARTRAMLKRGDLGGAAVASSITAPPEDSKWKARMLKAAMDRLSLPAGPAMSHEDLRKSHMRVMELVDPETNTEG